MAVFFNFKSSEPLELIGVREYNLNALKEIQVTDSYLGLDKYIRNCQNEEPFYNCTTRKYNTTILEECGCLPLKMRFLNKVFLLLCQIELMICLVVIIIFFTYFRDLFALLLKI